MKSFPNHYLKHANDWIYTYYGTPENSPDFTVDADDGGVEFLSAETFVTVCGYLAVLSALLVTMAPIPIMMRIRRENSVGAMPLLPFSSMTVNVSNRRF